MLREEPTSETQNMAKGHNDLDREKKTVAVMVRMYCQGHHGRSRGELCESCDELLQYALKQIDKCPFGTEKGACSQCAIHCYKRSMRKRIHQVMRYSGPRMFKRHPILAISHLLKKWKHRETNHKSKS